MSADNPVLLMPTIEDRLPQNAPGRFYVDSSCIDCDHCRSSAPDFFRRDDDLGQSIVFRQPVTETEIQLCVEAIEGCPTESIGQEDDV
jgi:ferredoxin